MKLVRWKVQACALTGLGALAACILACTSFSPDDKKIVYPAFDPDTGGMAVAVYDRSTAKSRLVFVQHVSAEHDKETLSLIRPQWMADGKRLVLHWPASGDSDKGKATLSFAVVPLDGQEPVRLAHFVEVELTDEESDPNALLMYPLPLAGNRVFTVSGSRIVSMDVISGAIKSWPAEGIKLVWAAGPDRLAYFAEKPDERMELGWLNPDTLAKEELQQVSTERFEEATFAFDRNGRIAVAPSKDAEVFVLEKGKPEKKLSIRLEDKEDIGLGQVQFSRDGTRVIAPVQISREGETGLTFGLIEIPLDGSPAVRTELVWKVKDRGNKGVAPVRFFDLGLSHDGKSLAVSSALLAAATDEFPADSCALFLVDLTASPRKVTKVPITLPAHHARIPK